ncbi:MAG TPA: methyltransferase domain-containing protein [Steroidobacteraceae bacterium]|nr:methyltransferase domain-containing protein [Steroidobacteraceae bacterium]
MNLEHLRLLACPACHGSLGVGDRRQSTDSTLIEGTLRCESCRQQYPVVGGIPRFVPRENYASGFGLEWTRHARTQYDSQCGIPLSRDRFFAQTHWPTRLDGQLILEVGSGSGRFTEQAANTGATIVSFDYSYAVEANYASNGSRENVLIVQADVFSMPFRSGTFDRVFCFGMLQHTPDPHRAFAALPRVLKPGGALCADIYKATLFRAFLHTKYYVRPFTRLMDPEKLYKRVCAWVDFMWPLASLIRRLPRGYHINWRLLVADYSFLGLQGTALKEWAYLDTFDMLAPRYDRPARIDTIRAWAAQAGLEGIEAEYTGHGAVLRATAPAQTVTPGGAGSPG